VTFHTFRATAFGVAIAAAGSSSLAAQADSGLALGPRLSLATVITQVTGGLAPGATIVLNPPDGLQAGQRVRAVPAGR
jgi:hypothetical protein